MPSYEQRINNFAEGKSLLRLARPVRNRADAFCDACGSAQARKLYALADLNTERHYFVGETCLQELAKRGVILRRFGKGSGQLAYSAEMKLRSLQLGDGNTKPADKGVHSVAAAIEPRLTDGGDTAPNLYEQGSLFPISLLIETAEHYQAIVSLVSSRGRMICSGTAREERFEEVWCVGGDGGLILEKTKRERVDAPAACLTRAWQQAHCQLNGQLPETIRPAKDLVELPIALLRLGAAGSAVLSEPSQKHQLDNRRMYSGHEGT